MTPATATAAIVQASAAETSMSEDRFGLLRGVVEDVENECCVELGRSLPRFDRRASTIRRCHSVYYALPSSNLWGNTIVLSRWRRLGDRLGLLMGALHVYELQAAFVGSLTSDDAVISANV